MRARKQAYDEDVEEHGGHFSLDAEHGLLTCHWNFYWLEKRKFKNRNKCELEAFLSSAHNLESWALLWDEPPRRDTHVGYVSVLFPLNECSPIFLDITL